MKSNHKNFVHLVGLYTYCKMMHGAYNVKLRYNIYLPKLNKTTAWSRILLENLTLSSLLL